MVKSVSHLFGTVCTVLLAAILTLRCARLAYSAPAEEDVPASAHMSARVSQVAEPSEPPVQGNSGEQAELAPGLIVQPRAAFPYTVRSGDTPASIASLLGVPLSDLLRANHLHEDSELFIGQTLRVPNPFLAREHELSAEIDRLSADKQAAEERAQKVQESLAAARTQVQDLSSSNDQYGHNLRMLPWWRAVTFLAAAAAAVMFAIMLVAVAQWWTMGNRFHAVADMNESLRHLDYKYKIALAKAELRFQELYGRRRRGMQDGVERAKTPEEIEIERLNRELKEILEQHLQRLDRAGVRAGRARWRERLASIGWPVEVRSVRR